MLFNFSSGQVDNLTAFKTKEYVSSLSSRQMSPSASYLSRKNLKYGQQFAKRMELGDMSKNTMSFDIASLEELTKSPLTKFITFSANDCGYNGST